MPNAPLEQLSPPPRWAVALAAAALFVLTLVIYAPTFSYGFIGYDDPLYVENAHARQGLTAANIVWAFQLGPDHAANFHPLVWLSHMLDSSLFGSRPGLHHAHSVVLHAVAAVVLLFVLYRMTGGSFWPSALVAALFAWHPLHVQSVAWVAERKDVLSGLLCFLALLAYERYARMPSAGRYAWVLVAGAGAMLAKPMLVTLPFVLMLLDYWPLKRRFSWKPFVIEKLPLLAMAGAVAALTVLAQRQAGAVRSSEDLPLSARIANVPVSYVRYLIKTIWPVDLAVFYPYRYWPGSNVAAVTIVLVAITVIALWQRRRRPYLIVGWLFFLGTLVPVIGLVHVGEQSIADRYTYLPLIGVFVMLAFWAAQWRRDMFVGVASVASVASIAAMIGTAYQVQFWRDDLTLFGRALTVTQDNYIAHGYVGKALAARQDDEAALAHYDRAIAIKPGYWETHYNRGNLLMRAGRLDDAIAAFENAVHYQPDHADAWNNLGVAYASQRRLAEAEVAFGRAASLAPERRDTAGNLARVRAARETQPN